MGEALLEKVHDIRVKRSMNSISDALINLLFEKNYENITIRDIAREANTSRTTFYRIYPEKDDILLKYLDELFWKFFDNAKTDISLDQNHLEIGKELLKIWNANRKFFTGLKKTKLDLKIIHEFTKFLFVIQKQLPRNSYESTMFHQYEAECTAGSIYMLNLKWILNENSQPETDNDLTGYFLGMQFKDFFNHTKEFDHTIHNNLNTSSTN